jgi:hypothetical protein
MTCVEWLRRLDTAQNTAVLLETVALVPYQDSGAFRLGPSTAPTLKLFGVRRFMTMQH